MLMYVYDNSHFFLCFYAVEADMPQPSIIIITKNVNNTRYLEEVSDQTLNDVRA